MSTLKFTHYIHSSMTRCCSRKLYTVSDFVSHIPFWDCSTWIVGNRDSLIIILHCQFAIKMGCIALHIRRCHIAMCVAKQMTIFTLQESWLWAGQHLQWNTWVNRMTTIVHLFPSVWNEGCPTCLGYYIAVLHTRQDEGKVSLWAIPRDILVSF